MELMTVSSAQHPSPAVCKWIGRDGTLVVFTAAARLAPPGLERYKCEVPGSPELAQRMRAVLSQARMNEPRFDSRWLVHLSVSTSNFDATDPHWELAAVLADRMARGKFTPLCPTVWAHGTSQDWTTGRVVSAQGSEHLLVHLRAKLHDRCHVVMAISDTASSPVAADQCPSNPAAGELTVLSHLGGLTGHPDPAELVSRASVWFPLVAGGNGESDTLSRVDIAAREVALDDAMLGAPDQQTADVIEVNGLPWTQRHAAASVVTSARMLDRYCTRRWHTVVSFSRSFHMKSYELALVLADRLARGRMLSPRGRLIATGTSENWSIGTVLTVEGIDAKCRLIERQAAAGDRVLLPKSWWPQMPEHFEAGLRNRGVSLAPISELRDLGALPPQVVRTAL